MTLTLTQVLARLTIYLTLILCIGIVKTITCDDDSTPTLTPTSTKTQFNINEWFHRIAEIRAKFDEKCEAGCNFNYDLIWGIWEAFEEPVEGLILLSGISVDIYPGLRDKILETCVDKTINYCDATKFKELLGCGMPLAKPYIGEIIKVARQNFIAVEAAYHEFGPKLMELLDNLKCEPKTK